MALQSSKERRDGDPDDRYYSFRCGAYGQRGKVCSAHYVRADAVEDLEKELDALDGKLRSLYENFVAEPIRTLDLEQERSGEKSSPERFRLHTSFPLSRKVFPVFFLKECYNKSAHYIYFKVNNVLAIT